MVPANAVPSVLQQPTFTTVMLDGKVIGYIRTVNAPAIVSRLRDIKAAKLGAEEMTPVGVKTIQLAVSACCLTLRCKCLMPYAVSACCLMPDVDLYVFIVAQSLCMCFDASHAEASRQPSLVRNRC